MDRYRVSTLLIGFPYFLSCCFRNAPPHVVKHTELSAPQKLPVVQLLKIPQHFMEPEWSLPHSQELSTDTSSKPYHSTSYIIWLYFWHTEFYWRDLYCIITSHAPYHKTEMRWMRLNIISFSTGKLTSKTVGSVRFEGAWLLITAIAVPSSPILVTWWCRR
jgi:hypothetical protein